MSTENRIMYVCEYCNENAPEMCGHFDSQEVRISWDGMWLCSGCVEHGDWPQKWETMAPIPIYAPISDCEIEPSESNTVFQPIGGPERKPA